jgi:hypothetical protein
MTPVCIARRIWHPLRFAGARGALLVFLLAALAAPGCEQPEDIVTYKIPRQVPEQLLPGEDRLLAVMFPRDEDVWFFKIMGPKDAVDRVDDRFREFVSQIEFDQSGEPVLDDLPEGWRRGANKPMRVASIDINTPEKQLDLSVSTLSKPPGTDDTAWDDYVVQNVNRWRGQVGLQPSQEKWSGGEPIEVAAAEGPAVWVDLVGKPSDDASMSMNAPFAGGGPFSGGGPIAGGGPSGAGPSGAGPMPPVSAPPAPAAKIDFDVPEGWRKKPAGGMRLVSVDVGPEDAPAEVTVIPAGGDLRSNVARWMGQVAGNQPDQAELDAMMDSAEKIEVSGRAATRFIIDGDGSEAGISIDATIVPLEGGRSMFIKMTGPPEVVAEQSDSMRTFLRSLSF